MAKLLLGFRIKSIPEQVSVYSSPQRSVDERYLLCAWESWRKVKIWKERAGYVSPEQLYHEPFIP